MIIIKMVANDWDNCILCEYLCKISKSNININALIFRRNEEILKIKDFLHYD